MALKVKVGGTFENLGYTATKDVYVQPYVRPTDWLALPAVNVGDQKFVGLHAVWDAQSNYLAFSAAGAYTVDWGDGTAPENVATGVTALHNYVYSAIGAGTLSTRGYRQVIVTITPQAGQNLTNLTIARKHTVTSSPAGALPNTVTAGWLDMRVAGASLSSMVLSTTLTPTLGLLEQFEFVGPNVITNWTSMFRACKVLQSIPALWTASGTNFSLLFDTCVALKSVPLINTAAGTSFQQMFTGCSTLTTVPLFNTAAALSLNLMFEQCFSLTSVPPFNTAACGTFTSMFTSCGSLTSVPLFNTAAGSAFNSMFQGCSSLTSVPLFNTAAGTNMNSMFSGCTSLTSVPLFNTANNLNFASMFGSCRLLTTVPLIDTGKGTDFSGMFSQCTSLTSVPLFNTTAGTSFQQMFNICGQLQTVPLFNTAAGTNFSTMFGQCPALVVIPALNLASAAVGNLAGMVSVAGVRSVLLTNISQSFAVAGTALGGPELDIIYGNLTASGAGKTINVTSCIGVGTDTPSIATAKGWTVTGS